MNREIKFELIWDNGTPKRVVSLNEINEMGEDFKLVAYIREFTGLKDKNGKEIYEGDIIKSEVKDVAAIGKVTFIEGEFKAIWFNNSCIYAQGFREYEIIGNIHENPELIK